MNSTNRVKQGRFITFEGVDGVGKSTQCRILYEYLVSKNIPVVSTRETGGTEIAEEMRSILVHRDLLPMSELLQVMAARKEQEANQTVDLIDEGFEEEENIESNEEIVNKPIAQSLVFDDEGFKEDTEYEKEELVLRNF